MKKKIFLLIIALIILIILLIIGTKYINNAKKQKIMAEEYNQMKENSIMYDETASLEDLKTEYKITGNSELYKIETDYDGRKVPVIKSSINFKVAFAGLIKKSIPEYSEIDEIFEDKFPTENGIWIEENSKKEILQYVNNNLGSQYEIDENGYLKIKEKNIQKEADKKIEKLINGNKQIILSISSIYYMVDTLTGEIVTNPYEDLDKYQTYDYVEDLDKMIIFITQNSNNLLKDDEIFKNILNLI